MKKIIILLPLFFAARIFAQFQEKIIDNSILAFSKENYETLVNSDETSKISFIESYKKNVQFPSLFNAIINKNNQSSIPEVELDDIDLIKTILNYQGIVKIGKYFYKIAFTNEKVFVMHEDNYPNGLNDLIAGTVGATSQIKEYSLDQDVISMVENGFLNESEYNDENGRFFCWSRSAATSKKHLNAIYFRDNSALKFSTFAECHNSQTFGKHSTNTRLKIELEYLRLGIYFTFYIKGKIQREDGTVDVNGDPVWRTCEWGTGESNWNINYNVFYRGKCRNDNEITESNTILPHINYENKARKVFWERITGLNYYCLSATANIFTDRAYQGPAGEAAFCVDNYNRDILAIPTPPGPRVVNSFEIYPNLKYSIRSNTDRKCD